MLACAPSNVAVDNLVERLGSKRGASAPAIVRLGHPARMTPGVLKFSLDAAVQVRVCARERRGGRACVLPPARARTKVACGALGC